MNTLNFEVDEDTLYIVKGSKTVGRFYPGSKDSYDINLLVEGGQKKIEDDELNFVCREMSSPILGGGKTIGPVRFTGEVDCLRLQVRGDHIGIINRTDESTEYAYRLYLPGELSDKQYSLSATELKHIHYKCKWMNQNNQFGRDMTSDYVRSITNPNDLSARATYSELQWHVYYNSMHDATIYYRGNKYFRIPVSNIEVEIDCDRIIREAINKGIDLREKYKPIAYREHIRETTEKLLNKIARARLKKRDFLLERVS